VTINPSFRESGLRMIALVLLDTMPCTRLQTALVGALHQRPAILHTYEHDASVIFPLLYSDFIHVEHTGASVLDLQSILQFGQDTTVVFSSIHGLHLIEHWRERNLQGECATQLPNPPFILSREWG